MKVTFPRIGEIVICERCKRPVSIDMAVSEDGTIDDFWCETCIDYVGARIIVDPGLHKCDSANRG